MSRRAKGGFPSFRACCGFVVAGCPNCVRWLVKKRKKTSSSPIYAGVDHPLFLTSLHTLTISDVSPSLYVTSFYLTNLR